MKKDIKKETIEKKRTISITCGRTINMGNYESIRLDIGMTRDLQPKEKESIAYNDLFDELQEEMDNFVDKMTEDYNNFPKRDK